MGAKRAPTGAKKPQKQEGNPPSEVDVSELVFSSGEETEEDSDGYHSENSDSEADVEGEIEHAVKDYVHALRTRDQGRTAAAAPTMEDGSEDDEAVPATAGGPDGGASGSEDAASSDEDGADAHEHDDPASDSSEDERPNRNTVGDVPLDWYRAEEHIGYDKEGARIMKKERKDRLDLMLERSDSAKFLRTVYDAYNDEEIVLTKDEMRMINRIRMGKFPHLEVDPFPEENHWFTKDKEIMPLTAAPEPKRRFTPSKWEEKKVVKLIRAIRKGWLKVNKEEEEDQETKPYLLWADDGLASARTGAGLAYIPAPKPVLPGHAESYNPPREYLPTEEELAAIEVASDDERPDYVPHAFPSLRVVPAYANFVKERFERCLDLYLCPRGQKKRSLIKDAKELVPQLPKPRDLQPFPTMLCLRFEGHTGPATCLALDPTGAWVAAGSRDGTVRLWEVRTGRCAATWDCSSLAQGETPARGITALAWCPDRSLKLLAVGTGSGALLLPVDAAASESVRTATRVALDAAVRVPGSSWRTEGLDGQGVLAPHGGRVTALSWHARGDYLAAVSAAVPGRTVLVHQLSRGASQAPFRKTKGRPVKALFHPTKAMLFLATHQSVRVYNLAKQELVKKLTTGSGVVTSMAIHASGDHLIIGQEDNRVAWFDLDLSSKPYKGLRFHTAAVRGVAYHTGYPLFASASDDGLVQVFHGMVYADLMTNPLIVPVKILRPNAGAVLDLAFHPTQPWVFSAHEDGTVMLHVNV